MVLILCSRSPACITKSLESWWSRIPLLELWRNTRVRTVEKKKRKKKELDLAQSRSVSLVASARNTWKLPALCGGRIDSS